MIGILLFCGLCMFCVIVGYGVNIFTSNKIGEGNDTKNVLMLEEQGLYIFPPLQQEDLSKLKQKEPEFSEGQFIRWSREMFWQIITASYTEQIQPLKQWLTVGFFRSCQNRFKKLRERGIKEIYKRKMEYAAAITGYRKQNQKEYLIVTLQVCLECYIIDVSTNEIVHGNPDTTVYTQYEMEFVRQNVGEECCPHCLAPIEEDGQQCAYCKSWLQEERADRNQAWLLCRCKEKAL